MELTQRVAARPPGDAADASVRTRLRCTIRGGDLAPGAARRTLERFAPVLDERRLDDARLLISELVTNSVRHAGAGAAQTIELTLRHTNPGVRVTVGDHGRGFDPALAQLPKHGGREGGRGLFLVDALADRWGVTNRGMTRVWFEIGGG